MAGAATNIFSDATPAVSREKYILSRQMFCRGKHTFAATKDVFCREKHEFWRQKTFAATKMILVALPASDSRQVFKSSKIKSSHS